MKHKTRQVALTLRFKKKTQSLLHHSTGYQICIQPCAEINKNNSNCQRSQAWMMCAYHKALIALEHCRLQEMSMPLLQEAYRQLCTSLFLIGDTSRNNRHSNPPQKMPAASAEMEACTGMTPVFHANFQQFSTRSARPALSQERMPPQL